MTWRKALLWSLAALLGVLLLPVLAVGAAVTAGYVHHKLTRAPTEVGVRWVEAPAASVSRARAARLGRAAGEQRPGDQGGAEPPSTE